MKRAWSTKERTCSRAICTGAAFVVMSVAASGCGIFASQRDFEGLRDRMRAAGLLQPHLTGSGSGVFGILPKGKPAREVTGRFTGSECLYEVRSTGRALRLRSQP